MRAVIKQNEGENLKMIRKQKASMAIRNLQWNGPTKHWSFEQHVAVHQKAHNEVVAYKEPMSETKKVTDFLAGITDPALESGLSNIFGDATKLVDFEACQQYLSNQMRRDSKRKASATATTTQMPDPDELDSQIVAIAGRVMAQMQSGQHTSPTPALPPALPPGNPSSQTKEKRDKGQTRGSKGGNGGN